MVLGARPLSASATSARPVGIAALGANSPRVEAPLRLLALNPPARIQVNGKIVRLTHASHNLRRTGDPPRGAGRRAIPLVDTSSGSGCTARKGTSRFFGRAVRKRIQQRR